MLNPLTPKHPELSTSLRLPPAIWREDSMRCGSVEDLRHGWGSRKRLLDVKRL